MENNEIKEKLICALKSNVDKLCLNYNSSVLFFTYGETTTDSIKIYIARKVVGHTESVHYEKTWWGGRKEILTKNDVYEHYHEVSGFGHTFEVDSKLFEEINNLYLDYVLNCKFEKLNSLCKNNS